MNITRTESLKKRHASNLRAIEKAKQDLALAQAKLNQTFVALGRTLALIDIEENRK